MAPRPPKRPPSRWHLRGAHLETLKQIALAGALRSPVELSSREIGERIGASQQAADRYLVELERAGLLERTKMGRRPRLALTAAGMERLRGEQQAYRRVFEGPARLALAGTVVSGLGEGRYYLSQPGYARQFPARVGYRPYPGTLNVELSPEARSEAASIQHWAGIRIDGFTAGNRTFGGATCHAARLDGHPCHLIRPDRTHYENVLELIAPVSLRRALKLTDGRVVKIEIEEA